MRDLPSTKRAPCVSDFTAEKNDVTLDTLRVREGGGRVSLRLRLSVMRRRMPNVTVKVSRTKSSRLLNAVQQTDNFNDRRRNQRTTCNNHRIYRGRYIRLS